MKQYDFILIFEARLCNPNGDMDADNEPRTLSNGCGLVSDVCLKHKIRNEMAHRSGQRLFLTEDTSDGFVCLNDRCNSVYPNFKTDFKANPLEAQRKLIAAMNETFPDARAFGFLIPYKEVQLKQKACVSIGMPVSIDPIMTSTLTITKCMGQTVGSGKKKTDDGTESHSSPSSDTVGNRKYLEYGLYVVYGAIDNIQAKKNNLREADIKLLSQVLPNVFDHDASSSRPAGSMLVRHVFWCEQEGHNISAAKILDALHVERKKNCVTPRKHTDYDIHMDNIPGLTVTDLVD